MGYKQACHGRGINPKSHGRGINPKSHSRGINPKSHSRGINPKSHSRGISPKSHSRGINPKSHSRGINPKSHSRGINPKSHGRGINPKSHITRGTKAVQYPPPPHTHLGQVCSMGMVRTPVSSSPMCSLPSNRYPLASSGGVAGQARAGRQGREG